MKPIQLFLLSIVAGLAWGQQNLPPCNSNANPPVTANCTDYFGVANFANSPLPAGGIITGFTITAGGSGYTAANTTVLITDPVGTGASATATFDTLGVLTAINVVNGGSGYIAPTVSIVDTSAVPGTGATASAVLAPPGVFTGGIRKFMDLLPSLPIAVADTTTFPGSDYYVIALVEYTQKMHTDLPPTKLRGYVQLNGGSGLPVYLGPLILAQKNRPVRVLFKNQLPTGAGGNLFIPVDTTYMGAGAAYTQNRATLHLHGGATPWISDGTPHQWTAPAGETGGQPKGVSTQNVPDMFFDSNGNLVNVPACSATVTTLCYPNALPPNVSNNPGFGAMTFYWTNQQGGRLMFYHDHAYGLTRLNVYAGEAAGYLLYDPAEEASLANATAPGTIGATTSDLGHLVPLVIQDKTFVPPAQQLKAEDPTWIAGGFGTTPGAANVGDLWFPHVYTPNQSADDPDGVNAYGRWDYGPWFFPPQSNLTAGPLTVPCTSSAFPGTPQPTLSCPITPNPSGTPEAFMDTPVVNGMAYPVLHVAPAAYRFQILAAGNDRSWNLQLYVADSTGKEVSMVPAVPPAPGTLLPACSTPTQITQPSLGIGLATAAFDSLGKPINGTGLPANCWPSSWPTDGRAGGVPDPRTAGPPMIQIGTEGGLLPAPVAIPSTPTGYEYNRRSVTVTNVSTHGLWLGPAERADAIVDFSAFAGKTLILYNDSPAPVPAFDERYDYYTGDPDFTAEGGAPSTQPGYGPNTRTVMQIVVDGNAPNASNFSITALQSAFSGPQGLFTLTQPTIVVPETAYNSNYNSTFKNTYARVQDNAITFAPVGSATPQTMQMGQKAIQELFTLDYGRMNATLGTELPLTNFLTQTTIPLGYIDPATEIFKEGDTQVWKLTHNGVDTHFIHFHLFNVQVVNRMGWDGTVRPPDANELGWKDTVRMNPLEDIVVAMQPIRPLLPWPIPDSIRLMDVTMPQGSTTGFTGVNPFSNAPAPVVNLPTNFGWEYVWHCHILGHEESDMMRPIIYQALPAAPSNLVAVPDVNIPGQVDLSWTDNSASESGFSVQRATDAAFTVATTTFPAAASSPNTAWGGTISITDTPGPGTFYYRVQAVDDNFKVSLEQTWNSTPALLSPWSNTAVAASAALVSLSPSTLTFVNQLVNTISPPQVVTLSNTGAGAIDLAISGITITGMNAADFTQSNNCGATLTAGSTCTLNVTFKPAATGARGASLNINSSNPQPLSVTLAGTGVAPVATALPMALSFGHLPVGTTSTAQTITLTNNGTSALIINSIAAKGGNAADFVPVSTCPIGGAGLAVNLACSITVTFKPGAMGARSSVIVINNSDPVTPLLNVSVAGVGDQAIAGIAPASVSFPLQLVNTSSAVQVLTLSNTGNVPLTITSIASTGVNAGDFLQSNTCSTALPAPVAPATSTSCTISLTFRPSAPGARSAALTINTTALIPAGGTLSVPLSGTSTAVNLSTTAVTFGAQIINTTSAPQAVTLVNAGTSTLAINSITLTGANAGDFIQISTCSLSLGLPPSRSCAIGIKFKPVATGVRVATLQITTNDPGVPVATVAITGTGTASAASLSPASVNFGTVTLNQTGGPAPVTLTNTGTAPLTINRISISGTNANQFVQNNTTCPLGLPGLAVGASCTINVTFAPTNATTTTKNASLNVTVAAPAVSQSVPLTGSINVPVFTLTPASLAFGTVKRGTLSTPQTVTVANTGTAPLGINLISLGGTNPSQFQQTNNCGSSVSPNTSCTITVTFAPAATAGPKAATLKVAVAAPATSQSVALSGTAQ